MHWVNIGYIVGRALYEDAKFLYAVLNNMTPEIQDKVALDEKTEIRVNKYWNRYQNSYRGVEGDTIETEYVGS